MDRINDVFEVIGTFFGLLCCISMILYIPLLLFKERFKQYKIWEKIWNVFIDLNVVAWGGIIILMFVYSIIDIFNVIF